jgi:hypothetical protein
MREDQVMSEIGDFIEARLAEDESLAVSVLTCCRDSREPWPPEQVPGRGGPVLTDFLRRFSEDRRLREVELHRAVLSGNRTAVDWGADDCPRIVLLLAAIWSAHPGYRAEWAPETLAVS